MQQKARVKKIISETLAEIEVVRKEACSGNCDSCHGCSYNDQVVCVQAQNEVDAKAGDWVLVESSTAKVLKGAVAFYVLPIIMMCVGYAVPFDKELFRIICSVLGLSVGMLFCVFAYRLSEKKKEIIFTITEILG